MGRLRDQVRERLEGLAERQAQRDAARAWKIRKNCLLSAKHRGMLDDIYSANGFLVGFGTTWVEERVYGMTMIATDTGLLLAYRPDGYLDRRPRREICHHFQEPLFTAETSASPSA